MEPITTVAVSTVVGYLAKKLKDDKSIQGFFDDFTQATVNWIKPIFIREDGTPKDALKELQANPDSPAQQNVAKSTLAVALEQNPQAEKLLHEMAALIETKKAKGETVSISQSRNVVTGSITSGGSSIVGDNNNVNT